MNIEKLRTHAALLVAEIDSNKGKSADVDWLSTYRPLYEAIEQIQEGVITLPYEIGLGRWVFESNIQDFPVLVDRLAELDLLLRGWKLPSETGGRFEQSD